MIARQRLLSLDMAEDVVTMRGTRTGNSCLLSVPEQELENVRWKLEEVFHKKLRWIVTYCMVKPWNPLPQG